MALTGAERQARYRARRKLQQLDVEPKALAMLRKLRRRTAPCPSLVC